MMSGNTGDFTSPSECWRTGPGLGWPMYGLGWAGLGWAGLGWAGLGWAGLCMGWAGLGWAGLGWAGLGLAMGWAEFDLERASAGVGHGLGTDWTGPWESRTLLRFK